MTGIAAILCGPVLGYALVGDPPVAWNNLRFGRAIRSLAPGWQTTLEQAVPFSWEAVYRFPLHTDRKEMEKATGFSSPSIQETVSEGVVQLLFVKEGRVVASVCGYAERLGYQIALTGKTVAGENRVFFVERMNEATRLTPEEPARASPPAAPARGHRPAFSGGRGALRQAPPRP